MLLTCSTYRVFGFYFFMLVSRFLARRDLRSSKCYNRSCEECNLLNIYSRVD